MVWYKEAQMNELLKHKRNLIVKDPIAIFLSLHLAKKFGFKVVVTVRHPAAIAAARRKLGWYFNFNNWRIQDDLWSEHFGEISEVIEGNSRDIIGNAACHWLGCYSFVKDIKEEIPEYVKIVRHEDFCFYPVETMRDVFRFADLSINYGIEQKIRELTQGNTLEKRKKNLGYVEARDAAGLIKRWRQEVSRAELEKIEKLVVEKHRSRP